MLKGLGVGKGDEVALQAFTCIANPEAIMAIGAKPLYIDIEKNGVNMDVDDLKKKLTSNTKAIVVQHTFGIPADLEPLLNLASEKNIPVIEDCCHTLDSEYKGKRVGSFGVGAFYSYEWGKPIVAGIGGSAGINDAALKEKVEDDYKNFVMPPAGNQLRLQLQYLAHSILYRPILYWPLKQLYHFLGSIGAAESNYNPVQEGNMADDFTFRMSSPLQKRLEEKLKALESISEHSCALSAAYGEINNPAVVIPKTPADAKTVFARFPLLVENKPEVLKKAKRKNVELAEWYATPIHPLKGKELESIYYSIGSCPEVEKRAGEIVTLPCHPKVSKRFAAKAVKFFDRLGN
jgi:dTDP-4-amino-4,6-dideoxygalactose transaminase